MPISVSIRGIWYSGPIPYFLVGTRAFLAFHPDPVQIRLDDKELEFSPLLVSIANAPEYGNGAIIAPSAFPMMATWMWQSWTDAAVESSSESLPVVQWYHRSVARISSV